VTERAAQAGLWICGQRKGVAHISTGAANDSTKLIALKGDRLDPARHPQATTSLGGQVTSPRRRRHLCADSGSHPQLRAVLREVLEPLALAGADQLVLASTHFTFLQPVIRSEFVSAFGFVDSASTVAGEVSTVLDRHGLGIPAGAPGSTAYLFTGDLELARAAVAALLNSIASQDGTVTVTEELDIRFALERQAL
jgi:hypothetical protein